MLKVFVDAGSSIKFDESKKYDVEILPLRVLFDNEEFLDGQNLSIDAFYEKLFSCKKLPKTSLPNLEDVKERVLSCTNNGDDVIILSISSGISGSYNAIKNMFVENSHVRVIDTKLAVGAIRILVEEINRNRTKNLDFVVEKVEKLIPRIKILAIPETLEYLLKGGRLSPLQWFFGTILQLKPIITFKNGKVVAETKKIGLKNAMQYIAKELENLHPDANYPIIASYTYSDENLKHLISFTSEKTQKLMTVIDNLDPAIASHWGPNACGFIFVET